MIGPVRAQVSGVRVRAGSPEDAGVVSEDHEAEGLAVDVEGWPALDAQVLAGGAAAAVGSLLVVGAVWRAGLRRYTSPTS